MCMRARSRCRHAVAAVGPYVFIYGGLRGSALLDDFLLADDSRRLGAVHLRPALQRLVWPSFSYAVASLRGASDLAAPAAFMIFVITRLAEGRCHGCCSGQRELHAQAAVAGCGAWHDGGGGDAGGGRGGGGGGGCGAGRAARGRRGGPALPGREPGRRAGAQVGLLVQLLHVSEVLQARRTHCLLSLPQIGLTREQGRRKVACCALQGGSTAGGAAGESPPGSCDASPAAAPSAAHAADAGRAAVPPRGGGRSGDFPLCHRDNTIRPFFSI